MNQERESFWQVYRRVALRTLKRDLLALPVVALLTAVVMAVLFGRDWALRPGIWQGVVVAFLLGCVAWPVAHWLLDRIFGRYDPPS